MNSIKTLQVIESIKNMSEKEASTLEVFVAGFRAGMETMKSELVDEQDNKLPKEFM